MLFMIIERFGTAGPAAIGERFRAKGRQIPPDSGVEYVASWMAADGQSCFQIMEAPSAKALEPWIAAWSDLAEFEVVPVQTSAAFWETFWASRGALAPPHSHAPPTAPTIPAPRPRNG